MAKRISVTRWLLEQSPQVVKKLERDGTFVGVGDGNRLNIRSMKLIVPMGIEVYQVIRRVRNLGEFFFLTRAWQDTNQAYLSHVLVDEGGWFELCKKCGRFVEVSLVRQLSQLKNIRKNDK